MPKRTRVQRVFSNFLSRIFKLKNLLQKDFFKCSKPLKIKQVIQKFYCCLFSFILYVNPDSLLLCLTDDRGCVLHGNHLFQLKLIFEIDVKGY